MSVLCILLIKYSMHDVMCELWSRLLCELTETWMGKISVNNKILIKNAMKQKVIWDIVRQSFFSLKRVNNIINANCLGHGRLQAWARRGTLPSVNVVKCFCALVVISKRSVDELIMHYFHNLSSASGGFFPRALPGLARPRWRTFVPELLICPPVEKNPSGANCLGLTRLLVSFQTYG